MKSRGTEVLPGVPLSKAQPVPTGRDERKSDRVGLPVLADATHCHLKSFIREQTLTRDNLDRISYRRNLITGRSSLERRRGNESTYNGS